MLDLKKTHKETFDQNMNHLNYAYIVIEIDVRIGYAWEELSAN